MGAISLLIPMMLPLSRVGNIKGKQQPSLLIMNKKLIQQLGEDSRKIQQTIHKQIGKPAEEVVVPIWILNYLIAILVGAIVTRAIFDLITASVRRKRIE